MASNSILLLAIFLVLSTKVYSYDEDLKIATSPQVPAPAPPVKAPTTPTPAPPVKSPSYPPVPTPTPTPPTVKVPPPPQSPVVKPPTPTPTPPTVKVPPPPQSPVVKPPTPTPTPTPPTGKVPPPKPPVVYPPPPVAPTPPVPVVKSKKDCIPLCGYRCQLHSRKKLCLRACMTCCDRCKCVPPGTYGNREKCGKCYTDMLTHGNKFKCP